MLPALRPRSQHFRKCGDQQRPRDENEWQLEVWCDVMWCVPTPAQQSNLLQVEGQREGGRRWTDRSLSSFHRCVNSETSFKTGSVLKKSLPPPNTTPDNAWDQNVFLMTLTQSFRYLKGILIFLQISSICSLLLLSVYIIPSYQKDCVLTQ